MNRDREANARKTPVHLPVRWPRHSRPIVFLTVNTRLRRSILANPSAHDLLLQAWARADDWLVGRYVIMPDHIHLLCAPANPTAPLERWVRFWKSQVTRGWPRPEEKPIWQPSHWDTQLRRGESLSKKWEYMCANPVRRGLVSDPDDWPYAGVINSLEWWN